MTQSSATLNNVTFARLSAKPILLKSSDGELTVSVETQPRLIFFCPCAGQRPGEGLRDWPHFFRLSGLEITYLNLLSYEVKLDLARNGGYAARFDK